MLRRVRSGVATLFLSSLAVVACAGPGDDSKFDRGGNAGTGNGQGGGTTPGGHTAGNGSGNDDGISIRTAECGNGSLDADEECDDSNKNNKDGCNEVCRIEGDDYDCSKPGELCKKTSKCGDHKRSSSETCDDGNETDGDGCSADCMTIEEGWVCTGGIRCVPFCGDKIKKGAEQCDDGNSNSGDGCSSTCIVEPGWSCDDNGCKQSDCGNGEKEAGEQCDNKDQNGLFFGDGKGCSKTCTPEPKCRDEKGTTACEAVCGDGNIDEGEECDDGNGDDKDGCSSKCKKEDGFDCTEKEKKDTTSCKKTTGTECLVLPIIYRDFDGQNVSGGGHPDFFYMGATSGTTKTVCVPNASGRPESGWNADHCASTDSTELCQELVKDTLGPDGKPVVNTGRKDGLKCNCRFTDWDTPHIVTSGSTCNVPEDSANPTRYYIETMVQVIQSEASFKQWYTKTDKSDETYGTLELAQLSGGNQYQFSSSNGKTVYDDLHDIFLAERDAAPAGAASKLSSGFFELEGSKRAKVCNLWPYWSPDLQKNCSGQQWDMRGWDGDTASPPACTGTNCPPGGPVKDVTGMERNFYFTTEARYLFRYVGNESLSFFGDDDVWVFLNGKLVLDLGAPHERLQGTVKLTDAGADWTISALDVKTNKAISVGKGSVSGLNLTKGKTYEIAVFHADRHPRESNYQLTLSGFSTKISVCQPQCGDGVVTSTEECDLGADNDDTKYGGCKKDCKLGPFCGDGDVNGESEECDEGTKNRAVYGEEGCTSECKKPRRCGDGHIDPEHEDCDDGANNGKGVCNPDCTIKFR